MFDKSQRGSFKYPMQYPYQCPICGHRETTIVQYPHIYYETINNKD